MPNIVHELIVELARVQAMFPQLDVTLLREAQNLLRFGRQSMALNNYEDMREALDDLKAFGRPPEPDQEA
ncbi:MAG: hypothetical protein ACRD59_10720 [Candidatus Acidiferrales bacterium]